MANFCPVMSFALYLSFRLSQSQHMRMPILSDTIKLYIPFFNRICTSIEPCRSLPDQLTPVPAVYRVSFL